MEIQLDQRMLLMLRRFEVANRSLDPLRRDLSGAREDLRSAKGEVEHLAAIKVSFEREIELQIREGADPRDLPQREEMDRIDAMIELEESRVAAAERRVIEAEDNLARARRRVEILEEALEELFEELE